MPIVCDVAVRVPGQEPVRAWLVRPDGPAIRRSLAGVIYLHWLEPPASTQNRAEFLDEAVTLVDHGAVAILPNLTFPWNGSVFADERDIVAVMAQDAAVGATYQALLQQGGLDPARTAVVGHDYGAMYGSMLAAREPAIRAEVFMAGDAAWADWFAVFFRRLDSVPRAYRSLFAGLDPLDNVVRTHAHRYYQWAGRDSFVTADVRDAFGTADPAAHVSVYPDAEHALDQHAKDDRLAWLHDQLSLGQRRAAGVDEVGGPADSFQVYGRPADRRCQAADL